MRSRVFNHDFERKAADVRYRDGALGTPSGDIAWTLGIESAAVHLRTGRARRKEWAQRYYSQADSDDGQYELGVAVRGHFTFPRIIVNALFCILADIILTAITVRHLAKWFWFMTLSKHQGRIAQNNGYGQSAPTRV
jgi:hypothetical protein